MVFSVCSVVEFLETFYQTWIFIHCFLGLKKYAFLNWTVGFNCQTTPLLEAFFSPFHHSLTVAASKNTIRAYK